MARWYLTTDDDFSQYAADICDSAGLKSSGFKSTPRYFVQAYEKRAIENTNFVEMDEDNWICSAGTIISDGNLGKDALQEIYHSFNNGGVEKARSNVIGHYAVAIKQDDSIFVFTDPHGSFSLYYTNQESLPFIASNSLQIVGKSIPAPNVNTAGVLDYAIQLNMTGKSTFYDGVRRLFGSQIINIDLLNYDIEITETRKSIGKRSDHSGISGAVTQYTGQIRSLFDNIRDIGPIALNTTGGLDTRTVLSALIDKGIQPLLIYGVGNSSLTNTKRSDLEIAKKISKEFDLSFYQMDWSGNHPHTKEKLQKDFKKYGFKYTTYGVPASMLEELDGGISPYPRLQISGYGPAFSNTKPWELPNENYSFEDLIDHLINDFFQKSSFNCKDEYRSYMRDAIRTAIDQTAIDYPSKDASLASLVQAQTFLRVRAASSNLNFMNEFTHYIAPFMMKRLHDPLVNIPMEYREDNEFQIRVTHELHPRTFDIPVFSGTKPQIIDTSSYVMKPPSSFHIRQYILSLLDETLPASLKPTAKKAYNRITQDPDQEEGIDERIQQDNAQHISDSELVSKYISDSTDLGLVRLNNLHRTIFGIKEIGYSSVSYD